MPIFKKLKYRHKIAAIIFLFSLVPMLIIGSILMERVWNGKVEDILAKNKVQLTSSRNDIDNLLISNIEKIVYINNNFFINNFLETSIDQNLVGVMSFNDYLQSIVGAVTANNNRTEIAIYYLDEAYYSNNFLRSVDRLESGNTNNNKSLKDEILGYDDGKVLWKFRNVNGNFYEDGKTDFICGYKKMVSLRKPIAITEIRIPFDVINQFFEYDIPKGSFILCEIENDHKSIMLKTSEMDVKFDKKTTEEYLNTLKLEDYYTSSLDFKSGIGKLSMYIPKKLIFQELKFYLITVIALFLVITGILFLSVEIVAFFLTKKLQVLFQRINIDVENLIKNDDIEKYSTDDEFGTMENRFHELIMKVKEYYKKVTDYELEKTVLETQLLQERINPHFLYNTLSTMKWICEDKKIQNVIDSMVKYYRIALNKGSSIVTINQELEMIEEYLRLQKFAYGNDFDFRINIEDGVGNYLVLKHLLQPVVENAVLHGLNAKETDGNINVDAKKQKDYIIFEIADNGSGMEPEKIEEILHGTNERTYGGYGMRNVQKRMEVFYRKEYCFEIKSLINQGTTVIMKIPAVMNTDVHNSMK